MKAVLITLGLTFSQTGSASFGESTKWAEGPFWKAPQAVEFNNKIAIVDQELVSHCSFYTKVIDAYKKRENPTSIETSIDQARKLGLSMQPEFNGRFEIIDLPGYRWIEVETNVIVRLKKDTLPGFHQATGITGIDLNSPLKYEIKSTKDSLTAFSKKLNLVESSVKTTTINGKLFLDVNGSDLACDLLSKKAVLKASVPTYVRITKDSSEVLSRFYSSKVSPEVSDVLVKEESVNVKAARLGFRLGSALDEQSDSKDNQLVEKQLGNLMDRLFIEKTLIPSSLLLDFKNNNREVNFSSSIDGAVGTLKLSM